MNYLSKLRILLFTLLILSSCREGYDTVEEYEKYVRSEEYPYLKTVVKNGVIFSLRYMPADAMMINHYKHFEETKKKIANDTLLTEAAIRERIKVEANKIKELRVNYTNSLYFMLTVKHEDENKDLVFSSTPAGFKNYSNWIQKLLFSLKEYIYLETPELEEVLLSIYHMERNYGMCKSRNFLLLFPKEFNDTKIINEKNKSIVVVINDIGLGTGKMRFEYSIDLETQGISNSAFEL
jgi:hypothetical protein